MMKFIEDRLEALDNYFEPKSESEKWIIIIGIAAVITYFAFEFLLPYTEELHKRTEVEVHAIEKSIAENREYLRGITRNGDRNYLVKKYDKDIKDRKKRIIEIRDKIAYVNANLNKLSDMLFNQKSWATFLNSITDKAEVHNVDIDYIKNKYVDSNGSFGYVLEASIECKSSYKNIVKFMNELEQNVLVTDIYGTDLRMDANSTAIVADINISVWGINR
jgi:lipopolysaccharide export LptBFGC system permease protein LptF